MAYNRYQYETSPRKIEPDYDLRKKQAEKKSVSTNKKQNTKTNSKLKSKALLYLGIGFMILFAISYRNSQITETFNKKETLKKELSAIQKENEQIEINIENSLNLNNVEQLAKEKLGMQKLNNSQKIYVSLDKKDYIEPAVEEVKLSEDAGVLEKIMNWFSNLIQK